jgi:hypothetical protein
MKSNDPRPDVDLAAVRRSELQGARYWIAFAICATAATIPLLCTGTLPMADLPEHLAQVAIWKHFDDPCHGFADKYELHFSTPYLFGYVFLRLLALLMTVTAAAKVVVWLAVILFPLSVRTLLQRAGGDPWLSLLVFPLAYGYSFYWGFLSWVLALPLAILHATLLFERRPRMQAILGVLLVASHGLMFAFSAALTLAMALVRRSWATALSTIPGAVLMSAFLLRRTTTDQGITWKLGFARVTDFPSLLFANAWEPAALVLIAAMMAIVALARPRVTRDGSRWVFAVVALAAYALLPFGLSGTAYVYPRFAVLVAIAALLLADVKTGRAARVLIVMLVVGWSLVLADRFSRFDAEARELDAILERVPPARRVAQMNVNAFSEHVPGPVFWHSGALYQVRRGGIAAWSFASLESWYPAIVRFRPGAEPLIVSRTTPADGIDWNGLLQYDYLLIRGGNPLRGPLRDAPQPLVITVRSGSWWLLETPRARTAKSSCAPLGE